MSPGRRLAIGRSLALVEAGVWFIALSDPPSRLGVLAGGLAVAAAIAAARTPLRSALLLVVPVAVVDVLLVGSLASSNWRHLAEELPLLVGLTAPAVIAALLFRTVPPEHAPARAPRRSTLSHSLRRGVPAAVVFGLLSIPAVAISFGIPPPPAVLANEGFVQGPVDWRPMSVVQAIALAVVVVVVAAIVGGAAGAWARTLGRIRGGAVALVTAWATAILALPVAAFALGIHLRTGIVCIMGCQVMLRDDQPLGGVPGYVIFVTSTAIVVWPLVAMAVIATIVLTVGPVVTRRRSFPEGSGAGSADAPAGDPDAPSSSHGGGRGRMLPTLAAIVAFEAVHGSALLLSAGGNLGNGVLPYLCLSVGVLVWTVWMDHEPSPGRAPQLQPTAGGGPLVA